MRDELVWEFLNMYAHYVDRRQEVIDEYEDEEIRIAVSHTGHPNKREDIYFFTPDDKLINGPVFHSQGDSAFLYQPLGTIQIRTIFGEHDSINMERIIQPYDESMHYSDDWVKPKYPEMNSDATEERKQLIKDHASEVLGKCVECEKRYITTQKGFEDGKYTILNENHTELICSDCVDDDTLVRDFLKEFCSFNAERYENYLRWSEIYPHMEILFPCRQHEKKEE